MPFLFSISISIFVFLFDALKFRALYSHLEEWVGRGGGVLGCVGEVCLGGVREVWRGVWRGGKSGWEACVGRVWGVRKACVRRVCWARVGIARSALLSGYLGKSGHLPRFRKHVE